MRFDKFNMLYEYMINGSENVYDQDGFVFADFWKIQGPKNLINYASKHLVNVGTGHTKSVFKLGDKVLKIARNEYGRGKTEANIKHIMNIHGKRY